MPAKSSSKSSFRIRVTPQIAYKINVGIVCFMSLVGLVLGSDAKLYYYRYAQVFLSLLSLNLIGSSLMMLLGMACGDRIQKSKTWTWPDIKAEILESTLCIYVAAGLGVWPVLCSYDFGRDISLTWDLSEATYGLWDVSHVLGGLMVLIVQFWIWFFADLWTYWKHWCLHSPVLFAWHKTHHGFYNPTSFAGFAISPLEAVWTFGPSVLFCFPGLVGKLYVPVHLGSLFGFIVLNMYLHCGYTLSWVEFVLPQFYINTSAWHNIHHEKTVVNLGEVSPFWDFILGTYDKERYQQDKDIFGWKVYELMNGNKVQKNV